MASGVEDGGQQQEEKGGSMRREASVEDLFAPMWRLDVHSSSQGEAESRGGRWSSSARGAPLPIPIPMPGSAGDRKGASGGAGAHSWPSSTWSGITGGEAGQSSSYSEVGAKHHHQGQGSELPPSNSASDDDQVVAVDERKQRRMLSNRESARRSRLRKQQHLDELRAQVAHLRGENNQIMTKFNLTSQQYAEISEQNQVLRSHAMDLSRKLQRLHHAAVGVASADLL